MQRGSDWWSSSGWVWKLALLAQAIHGRGGITLPAPPRVEATPVTRRLLRTPEFADNYRWLEDAKSEETRAFIDAENAYTTRYLEQARIRPADRSTIWTRWNMCRAGRCPSSAPETISLRSGWPAKDRPPSTCATAGRARTSASSIRPYFSRDPNTSVDLADVSRDGTLVAYGVRQGGADETTVHVFNVKTRKTLEDELPAALYWS